MATFTEALSVLARLRALPAGWDYGNGGPIALPAMMNAMQVLQLLNKVGTVEFDIVPGIDGAVTIFGYQGDESVEIQAFADGSYDFLHENGDEPGELSTNLSLGDLAGKLEECGWRSQRLFVSCTRGVTWPKSGDMRAAHFRTLPGVGFPLLIVGALPNVPPKFAHTFANSMTKEFAESRLSSGEFRELKSLPAHV